MDTALNKILVKELLNNSDYTIEYLREFKNCSVYCYYHSLYIEFTGYPTYILVDGGVARYATVDEDREIFDTIIASELSD